jgi:hypothetical protein
MLERPAKRLDVHQTPDPTYYAPGKEGRLKGILRGFELAWYAGLAVWSLVACVCIAYALLRAL